MHWKNEKIIEENISVDHLLKRKLFQETSQDEIKDIKSNIDELNLSQYENLIELRTKPSESLIFSKSFNSINLKLYNDNSFPIIFKLKTTQPDIIASQPARGFIQPNSFIECHLTSIEIEYRILLVIQYAQIINFYDDFIIQWKNLKSEKIHLKKFQCTFHDKNEIYRKQTLIKPILFTFATITLLTTFIYLKNK